ncbi:hypothetical protein [Microcoleus sp. LEGE 07076]
MIGDRIWLRAIYGSFPSNVRSTHQQPVLTCTGWQNQPFKKFPA